MEPINPKRSPAVVGELVQEAMAHLKFCLQLCLRQREAGRLFIFEHADAAASRSMEMVNSIAKSDGIHGLNFDMTTKDEEERKAAARKKTAVLTNSNSISTLLRQAHCRGDHQHQPLVSGSWTMPSLSGQCQQDHL